MGIAKSERPQRLTKIIELISAFIFFALLFYLSDLISPRLARFMLGPEESFIDLDKFDWTSLSPSRRLEYHPCYGTFQCARLQLPMDWTADGEHLWDKTVAVALLKLPAVIQTTDPRYGGEIYLNPGGPGGSGVEYARAAAGSLASLVSAGLDDKLYDIVGFDPRGVMHSTPRPDCFPDLTSRQLWYHMNDGYEAPSNSNRTLARLLARAQAYRALCDPRGRASDKEFIKRHMSSSSVARDLLAIIDRSAESELEKTNPETRSERQALLLNRTTGLPRGMLQYWGFSYGTTLGGYFASLYPERVERMILDANSHFEQWITGNRSGFITQSETAFRQLYSTCYAAGKENCALYDAGGPVQIERSVINSLERLRDEPIPIWINNRLLPDVLTYETVVAKLFSSLYAPYRQFPPLANALAALGDRSNITALEFFFSKRDFTCTDRPCELLGCLDRQELYPDAGLAVLNSDTTLNGTLEDFFNIAGMLRHQSPMFGEKFQIDVATGWNAWPVEPKWRFIGPMGGRTKHPILFIGNTGDPVGPVENAKANAMLFEGSVALTQDSLAHGSISAPSLCTARYIHDYFQAGTLPTTDTVCKADWQPFEEPHVVSYPTQDDDLLLSALHNIIFNRYGPIPLGYLF